MGLIVKYNSIEQTLRRFRDVMSTALNTTKDTFSSFVATKKYDLQFDARSIYFSAYLNQQFDAVQERIYIINSSVLEDTYIYKTSESIASDEEAYTYRTSEIIPIQDEVYLAKLSLNPGISFQVILPNDLSALQTSALFIASIEKYNFTGKTYQIIVTP